MTIASGSHLSTSRIARLLRPLRAKSNLLAIHLSSAPTPGISSASTGELSGHADGHGSETLAIIPPPERLGSLIHVERSSREKLTLSRKIYDVRDAFRNVVQAIFGTPFSASSGSVPDETNTAGTSVMSLAAMCAKIVGDNIEDQVQLFLEECGDDDFKDDEALEVISELYEAVAPHYRRFAVVSHALSIILKTCPLHATLLSILLDVALSYNLASESCILLHSLFSVAFQPPSAFSSHSPAQLPISHPANANFITFLRTKCCRSSSGRATPIDDCLFASILSEVVTERVADCAEAWTCKAMRRLGRELRLRNSNAFLRLCAGISQSLSALESNMKGRRAGKQREDMGEERLRKRLAKWLNVILSQVHSRAFDAQNSRDSEIAAPGDPEYLQRVIEFLTYSYDLELHKAPPTSHSSELADSLICLGTLCLAATRKSLSTRADNTLSKMLRETRTTTATFDALMALILAPEHSASLDLPNSVSPPPLPTLSSLRRYIDPLCARSLFVHEASLLSSALRRVEALCDAPSTENVEITSAAVSSNMSSTFADEFEVLRNELVECVEEAERRIFGSGSHARGTLQASSLELGNEPHNPADKKANCEWEWEELFECWVPKSLPAPTTHAPKRRKLRHNTSTAGNFDAARRRSSACIDSLEIEIEHERLHCGSHFRASVPLSSSSSQSSSSSTLTSSSRSSSIVSASSTATSATVVETEVDAKSKSRPRFQSESPDLEGYCNFDQPVGLGADRDSLLMMPKTSSSRASRHGDDEEGGSDEDEDDDEEDEETDGVLETREAHIGRRVKHMDSSDDALDLFAYPAPPTVVSQPARRTRR